jgi:predicted nucleic acid-binding protein
MARVVADASVLIALAQIGQLPLLEGLFGEIVIPAAMAREVAPSLPQLPTWIRVGELPRRRDRRVEEAELDPGESEALALALQVAGGQIILDDLPARHLAGTLGLPVIGTAGVLLAAKRSGLIPTVRPLLDALRTRGFRLRPDVYDEVLRSAGERSEEP